MPRKAEIPEYNKPEQDYIKDHFKPVFLAAARQRLCKHCVHDPCMMLPITTTGHDCPYYQEKPNVES